MTNQEAIKVLKSELDGIPSDLDKTEFEQAVNMAIEALEDRAELERLQEFRCHTDIYTNSDGSLDFRYDEKSYACTVVVGRASDGNYEVFEVDKMTHAEFVDWCMQYNGHLL